MIVTINGKELFDSNITIIVQATTPNLEFGEIYYVFL
jgi:hypothetical protein